MIYYLFSERFHKIADAKEWAEKQRPRMEKIGSKLFIQDRQYARSSGYFVWRSQCEEDLTIRNMKAITGLVPFLTFHEYVVGGVGGYVRKTGGLLLDESDLGKGVHI